MTFRGNESTTFKESLRQLSSTMTTINCDCSTDIRVRTATALKVMSRDVPDSNFDRIPDTTG